MVGYMGDGINDAPSLHAADVGISVSSAVDVARESADIILLKPGLQILHNGIIEGRRASANVMVEFWKHVHYGCRICLSAISSYAPEANSSE